MAILLHLADHPFFSINIFSQKKKRGMYAPLSESIQQLTGIDGMRAVIEGKRDLFLPGKLAPHLTLRRIPGVSRKKESPLRFLIKAIHASAQRDIQCKDSKQA